jgi:hypothetical protein
VRRCATTRCRLRAIEARLRSMVQRIDMWDERLARIERRLDLRKANA